MLIFTESTIHKANAWRQDTDRVAVFNCYNSLWQQWHPLATERPGVTAVSREEILQLPPKRRSLFRSPWEDWSVANTAAAALGSARSQV